MEGKESFQMSEMTRCIRPDCIYRCHSMNGGNQCDYLTITGKSRIKGLPERLQLPCFCPRYVPDGTEQAPVVWDDWRERALALYQDGATDRQIEAALGLKKGAACAWRHKNRLPLHPDIKGSGEKYDWKKARALYNAGASDMDIMRELGCSQGAVFGWRWRNKLPVNPSWYRRRMKGRVRECQRGGFYDWKPAQELWKKGAADMEIAKAMGCSRQAVRDWRAREGLERNPSCRKEKDESL